MIKIKLSLSEEKFQKILIRSQKTLNLKLVSVREVSQLTRTLSPTLSYIIHINALELKAAKFLILAFTQNRKHLNSIDIQMDNMVAVSCLVKIEWKGGGEAKS